MALFFELPAIALYFENHSLSAPTLSLSLTLSLLLLSIGSHPSAVCCCWLQFLFQLCWHFQFPCRLSALCYSALPIVANAVHLLLRRLALAPAAFQGRLFFFFFFNACRLLHKLKIINFSSTFLSSFLYFDIPIVLLNCLVFLSFVFVVCFLFVLRSFLLLLHHVAGVMSTQVGKRED